MASNWLIGVGMSSQQLHMLQTIVVGFGIMVLYAIVECVINRIENGKEQPKTGKRKKGKKGKEGAYAVSANETAPKAGNDE